MILTIHSRNAKLGRAAATYLPLTTCPATCAFKGSGCYAEGGKVAIQAARLERALTPGEALTLEAIEISAARPPPGRPLRLHVSGDVTDVAAVQRLSVAAYAWRANGGGPVWSYTHAWRTVPRWAWGRISVLASCESERDAARARAEGYAPAVAVATHPPDGRARDGVIPCPAQTRGAVCSDCRLCFDDARLLARGASIAFAVHGGSHRRALRVIQ